MNSSAVLRSLLALQDDRTGGGLDRGPSGRFAIRLGRLWSSPGARSGYGPNNPAISASRTVWSTRRAPMRATSSRVSPSWRSSSLVVVKSSSISTRSCSVGDYSGRHGRGFSF